jgi:2-hydroxychromene-2-carboxylate isomerase/NAD(P)H-dependent FMN reductase
VRIVGVCGSLQAQSSNRQLLETAVRMAPDGVQVTLFEGLRELPPFDPDAPAGSVAAVERWREALRTCDAALLACPEYGFSLPGVVKNAIDWVIGTGELERKIVGLTAAVTMPERGRLGLEAASIPLRAVSARIVGGRPIVRGPAFADEVAALLRAIARACEREREADLGEAALPRLEVWFDFASSYSYPAVSRVEDLARRSGVEAVWRPFLLGPIFEKQGWSDSPFNVYPAKGRYAWRDLERECARMSPSLPLRRPSVFPRSSVRAARIATASEAEPWCTRFVQAVFRANFAEDRDIGSVEVLAALLADVGVPAAEVLAHAESADQKPKLRRQTERAVNLGIFGAPTFVAGGEIFWGNDRLEQAIAWARSAADA